MDTKSVFFRQTTYLLIPVLMICFLVWIVPFCYQIYLSLMNYNLNSPSTLNTFAGLANYKETLLKDSFFGYSLIRTVFFTFFCLILEVFFGMIVAFLLFELKEKYAQKILAFLIIPMVLAPFTVALIWYFQYNPDFGPLSIYLRNIKLFDQAFLGKEFAFLSVCFVDIWEFTPFMVLILYSGLRAIPISVRESLKLDDISYFLKIQKIYFPYILPIFLVAVFLRVLGLLKTFDIIYILTGGGPGNLTEVFSLYAQRLNYKEFNFGLGAAQGVIINYTLLIIFNFIYKKLRIYR